jgi:hypothetical protein
MSSGCACGDEAQATGIMAIVNLSRTVVDSLRALCPSDCRVASDLLSDPGDPVRLSSSDAAASLALSRP